MGGRSIAQVPFQVHHVKNTTGCPRKKDLSEILGFGPKWFRYCARDPKQSPMVQNLKFRKVLFSGDTLYVSNSVDSASTLNFTVRCNTVQSTACTPLRSARGWTSPSSPSVPPPSTCSTPAPPSTCSRASPGSSTCRLVRLSGEVRRRGEGRRVTRRRRRRSKKTKTRRISSSLTNFYSKVKEKDRFGIPRRTFTS